MPSTSRRWVLFLVVLAAVLLYAATIEGENAALIRSFLRNLLRQLS